MFLETSRFGRVEVFDDKILNFEEGLPGFEGLKRFVLLQYDETKPVCWLQAVDDGAVSLPVMDPFLVKEDYTLDVGEREIEGLKIENVEDLFVLNVVVLPEDISKITINLLAPIIINVPKNLGKQIIIDSTDYPTRFPMFEQLGKILNLPDKAPDNVREGVGADAGAIAQGK